jgi:hypothetical protein
MLRPPFAHFNTSFLDYPNLKLNFKAELEAMCEAKGLASDVYVYIHSCAPSKPIWSSPVNTRQML